MIKKDHNNNIVQLFQQTTIQMKSVMEFIFNMKKIQYYIHIPLNLISKLILSFMKLFHCGYFCGQIFF